MLCKVYYCVKEKAEYLYNAVEKNKWFNVRHKKIFSQDTTWNFYQLYYCSKYCLASEKQLLKRRHLKVCDPFNVFEKFHRMHGVPKLDFTKHTLILFILRTEHKKHRVTIAVEINIKACKAPASKTDWKLLVNNPKQAKRSQPILYKICQQFVSINRERSYNLKFESDGIIQRKFDNKIKNPVQ